VPPPVFAQFAHDEPAVTPIFCQPADVGEWKHPLATIEAVIDAAATYNSADGVKVFNLVTEAVKTVRPAHIAKLTYVETSGACVHGKNRDEIVTDTTPTVTPNPFAAWKVVHERNLVGSTPLYGIVIRPV